MRDMDMMEVHPSAGGQGFCYQYFCESAMTEAIKEVSHLLCLAHFTDPARAGSAERQPLFSELITCFKKAEAGVSYFPFREQIAMFLRVRATCSFAFTFCTRWYQEYTRGRLAVTLACRDKRPGIRSALGCMWLKCDIAWLERGWLCPESLDWHLWNRTRGTHQ
jgi:hypothetical protein